MTKVQKFIDDCVEQKGQFAIEVPRTNEKYCPFIRCFLPERRYDCKYLGKKRVFDMGHGKGVSLKEVYECGYKE